MIDLPSKYASVAARMRTSRQPEKRGKVIKTLKTMSCLAGFNDQKGKTRKRNEYILETYLV